MFIHIIHPDGSVDRLPHVKHRVIDEIGKQSRYQIFSHREDVRALDLNRYDDEIEVRKEDGTTLVAGVLRDLKSQGVTTELIVGDFETYARDAEPSTGDLEYNSATDKEIVEDAINDVPQLNLSGSTISNLNSDLDFIFSYANPAKRIRKVAEATGAEIRYNDDKTVDYVDALGSTRSQELSPRRGNLTMQRIDRGAADPRVTHLMMIGAGEGKAQTTTTVTASDYVSSERKKWRVHAAKDVSSVSTLNEIGQTVIEEKKQQRIDVNGVVTGVDVNLGDTFQVVHEEEDLDASLRVPKVEYVKKQDGEEWRVTMSNTAVTRSDPGQQVRRRTETSTTSLEGSAVQVSEGPGRGPVDADHDYVMDFYYPGEVQHEYRVDLKIKGLNFRGYSGGSRLDSIASMNLSTFSAVSPGSTVTLDSFTMPSDWNGRGFIRMIPTYSGTSNFFLFFEDSNANEVQEFSHDWTHDVTAADITHGDLNAGETYDVLVKNYDGGNNVDFDSNAHGVIYSMRIPSPTIADFDGSGGLQSLYPKNCNIDINNDSTVINAGLGDGSSPFEATVDLSGHLNPGQWNTVKISSEAAGHIDAKLSADLYRLVRGQG